MSIQYSDSLLNSPRFPQQQHAQPIGRASSDAPTLIQFPIAGTGHLPPGPIPNSHRDRRSRRSHSRHHSGSQVPSPVPSPSLRPSPSPAPFGQGSDTQHHQHHHHQSRSSQGHVYSPPHSQDYDHSRHGSHPVTPAPPMHISQNSEPIAPYMLVPTTAGTASEYQQPNMTPLGYGLTLDPTCTDFPMPLSSPTLATTASHGITSQQFPPTTSTPPAPSAPTPGQARALHMPYITGSRPRKSLLAQELDAPKATSDGRHSHPLFRHSRCTGKRKAVCVGVNYTGQKNELRGCVNDARNMYQFLMEKHRYSHSNIIVLTDDNTNPRNQPTRKNMLNAIRWLVEDACPDDALVIHYSGHGGRTRDLVGDEADGWDDVIFPVDYKTTGIITDDELHKALVEPLPPGCRLTGIFDSCHSASIMDLPFEYHSNGQLKSSPVAPTFINAKASPADVITFSGSMDTQTSADIVQNGVAVGAMSYALLKVLKRNSRISYLELLRGVRAILSTKYSQKPQLSSSHIMDMGLQFIM